MKRVHDSAWRRASRLLAVCVLMTLTGCDEVPTLPELLGKDEPIQGKVPDQNFAPVPAQADSGPPVLADRPSSRSPQQVVDEFLATEPRLRTSSQLEELLKLDQGVLQQITALDLSDSPLHDASAGLLPRFPALTSLNLSGTLVTNEGMAQVAQIEGLQTLLLDRLAIDAQGLEALADRHQLREISLVSTPISDPAFSHLQNMDGLEVLRVSGTRNLQGHGFNELLRNNRLPNLRELEASGTGFGYYGLGSIDKLTALEVLRVADAQVSDQTMQVIGRCRNLKELDLRNNLVGDEGLKHLAKLSRLESLWLAECGVSDTGLNHLRGLKSLQQLDLTGTLCTPAAARQLKDRHLTSTRIRLGGEEF
jgi:Leucine-rich repeat (LRR) protein